MTRCKWCTLAVVASFTLMLSGCQDKSAEGLFKQQIQLMNEMAAAVEDGDQAKFEEIKKKSEDLREKVQALDLPEEEMKRLGDKYKEELQAAIQRIVKAGSARAMEAMRDAAQ